MIAGFVQGCPAGEVFDVDIGSSFDEFPDSADVAFDAGQVKLSLALLVTFVETLGGGGWRASRTQAWNR